MENFVKNFGCFKIVSKEIVCYVRVMYFTSNFVIYILHFLGSVCVLCLFNVFK